MLDWLESKCLLLNSSGTCDRGAKGMTMLDVVFKYGMPPGEKQMLALNNAWEVYGVRKIKFDEKEHTVRVEYDATRLNDGEIAAILRGAGIDLRERVQLV